MKIVILPNAQPAQPLHCQVLRDLEIHADTLELSRNDLQQIYDAIPGAPPTKRLRNRPTAIAAIWKALPDIPQPVMERKQRDGSMKEKLIQLMKVGATIQELITLTSWQAHTIRGCISTLRSKGLPVTTTKKDGVTVYGVTE